MERLTEIKGAVFDLDGTVLDSTHIWQDIDVRFLAKRGIALPDDYAQSIAAMEFYETAVYTIERFGLSDTPELLMEEWTEMSRYAYAHEIWLKDGVKEVLDLLRERGVRLAVATSATEDMFVPALKNNGIYDMFSAFVTTSEVGIGKSDPAVYVAAAERLGLTPAECAVFEDIDTGIRTAKSAGFLTVGVYDEFSKGRRRAVENASDIFAEDYSDIVKILHKR